MSNVTSTVSNGALSQFGQYVITNPNAVKGGTDGDGTSDFSNEHVNI